MDGITASNTIEKKNDFRSAPNSIYYEFVKIMDDIQSAPILTPTQGHSLILCINTASISCHFVANYMLLPVIASSSTNTGLEASICMQNFIFQFCLFSFTLIPGHRYRPTQLLFVDPTTSSKITLFQVKLRKLLNMDRSGSEIRSKKLIKNFNNWFVVMVH